MNHNTKVVAALMMLVLVGCGGSKELKKDHSSEQNEMALFEKSFQPSDYDVDVKVFLAGLKQDTGQRDTVREKPKAEPPAIAPGFRVQLLATTEIDEANAKKLEAETAFPNEWFYIIFDPPTYKLRAGNFLLRTDAENYASFLQDMGYPDAWVVPEKVFTNILPRLDTATHADSTSLNKK